MTSSNYHLMRNFISVMRSLGYPRQMSIENFRNPNFPLMADILIYLLKRFDPKTEIDSNVDTEEGRLKFIMNASHLMVNKANLDINVKKLYMADINSVYEMIKLAKLIQEAWISLDQDYQKQKNQKDVINEEDEHDNDGSRRSLSIDIGEEFDRTKLSQYNSFKTSQITSEIYQVATKLYDTIAEHDQNKDHLQKTLNKQLVIDQIELQIRQNIRKLQEDIVDMQQRKQNIDRDNDDLNGKIEKKLAELNRNRKRLQTLQAQRPGYQDELEKIEQEIIELYDQYVTNSRCLYFLEQKLEEFEELERLKIDERNKEIKQMLEQIKIDDFLKTNKDMRITSWNQQNSSDERSDELAAIVDVDEDRISGSDLSDKDINEIPKKDNETIRRNGRQKNKLNHTNDKKERLLMANTVVKSQRSPVNLTNNTTLDTTSNNNVANRSAKTARIFSYGSLLENDDDDDEDDDDDSEHSETNAKMSDSEIDLDAIDSDDDDDSINSTEVEFTKPKNVEPKIKTNSEIKISASNLDKGDDDF
uniref:Clusterin-associated protein 1 homolog n=1 Tax=Dermatophagoides pteronyssinus TaxID=6956 RepID=A0A6P6YJH9_DERPT|nr:clusterin-associated protein 1 homolog [Dermatophagoides pteronyssinus]